MSEEAITPAQCRAARALLSLRQDELAAICGLMPGTIRSFEKGQRKPHKGSLQDIRDHIELCGVDFIWGGVVLRAEVPKTMAVSTLTPEAISALRDASSAIIPLEPVHV